MLHSRLHTRIVLPLATLVVACGGSSGSNLNGSGVGGSGSSSLGNGGASGASSSGGFDTSSGQTSGASADSGAGNSYGGFPGSGTSFAGAPLSPGLGPDTKDACPTPPSLTTPTQVIGSATSCFYGDTPDPDVPAATIEQVIEVVNGQKVVHIRITFNPSFVDNTYGDNAVGWGSTTSTTTTTAPPPPPKPGGPGAPGGPPAPGGPAPGGPGKGGHTFDDLVGSDHVDLQLYSGDKTLSFEADVDYISQDPTAPCGYGNLGVTGGDGKMITGSASDVLAVATSLDRDLNGCGYCLTENSPATDASYTPNPSAPKWDYRVVYELWMDANTFDSSGFGYAVIRSVHASPSKIPGSNTITVTPKPCPPNWNHPYCSPDTSGEGQNCGSGTGGSGGSSTSDGGGICPEGTVPDLASEGKFCVPT